MRGAGSDIPTAGKNICGTMIINNYSATDIFYYIGKFVSYVIKNIDFMRPARNSSLHSEKAVGATKVAKPPLFFTDKYGEFNVVIDLNYLL